MKKIIIIGCPGSGKSTFSRKLRHITGLPLYHLDMLYWNSDRTTVSKDEFIRRLQNVIMQDMWIIDGNYGSTMESRIKECDTVFFLDYSTQVCLDGVKSRMGQPRSDMPWVEYVQDDEFVEYIKNFEKDCRPAIVDLLEKYSEKNIVVLRTREEAEKYLYNLSNRS